jgi:hypothetical protein
VAEPLVGVLLALVLTRPDGFVKLARGWTRVVDFAGCAALGGLVVLMLQLSVDDPRLYRGGFLLGAVLAAVVVLASTQRTLIGRALSAPPLVALGVISYAVYLFHWPIFGWVDPDGTAEPARVAAEVALTIALAAVSTTLLEQPIRNRRPTSSRVFAAGWADASVAAIAAVVIATSLVAPRAAAEIDLGPGVEDAVPPPPPVAPAAPGQQALAPAPTAPAATTPAGEPTTSTTAAPEPVTPEEAEILTGRDAWAEGDVEEPPPDDERLRVAVIGDSLAHNIATGLIAWAETRTDVVVYDLSVSFCPLSRGGERRWEDNESFDVHPGCSWWNDPYSERAMNLAAFAPDVVLNEAAISEMLDRRQWHWDDWLRPGDYEYHRWLLDEYDAMFNALQSITGAATKYLTLNAPCGDFSRARGWRRVSEPHARVLELDDNVYPFMARSSVGDLFEQLCPNGYYTEDLWGIEDARPDGVHLTDEAAAELARRWLGPLLQQIASVPAPVDILRSPPDT